MYRPELYDAIEHHFTGRTDLAAVRFPVLLLNGGVGPAHRAAALRLVTEYSLERGDVLGMRICDSAGQEFVVRGATAELDLGPTGITRWKAVSYDLEGPRPITFEEIRQYLSDPEEIGPDAERLAAQETFDDLYDLVIRLQP